MATLIFDLKKCALSTGIIFVKNLGWGWLERSEKYPRNL